MHDDDPERWHPTACILCSVNCGIEVRLDGPTIARVRGDKAHPASKGYTCEKGLRVDHYQNGPHRLTTPLRRRDDGTFNAIDWDTAIAEVAARFADIRRDHGGERILFYGGGGQGNHLGGGYGGATRSALGIRYTSNALAQEKTGEFWVDGQLYGRSTCHTSGDFEHAQVAVFWGKNPWQSHGIQEARRILKEIARDPDRTLIVVDPRRTESADLADIHLRPRPGTDAHLLAALLATLVDEDLLDRSWLAAHTQGLPDVLDALAGVDIATSCDRAGVAEHDVRAAARAIGTATGGVSILEDLGIQMAPHSTLDSYLEKLVMLLTGNLGVPGGMNIHSHFVPLLGGAGRAAADGPEPATPVTGHRLVTGLVPCNVIPDEILTDHPDRFRAMLVESGNPVHSLADSVRMREALRALELVVVIDVALTETAREAHYVLPAASQYEKWECTFFNLEFPDNVFHLRRPILEPMAGTLPEYEIHARLCRALGVYGQAEVDMLRSAAGDGGRAGFAEAFFGLVATRPELGRMAPVLMYEGLGPSLTTPDGVPAAGAAAVWGLAHRCAQAYEPSIRRAGIEGEGLELGEALFDAILASPSGVVFSRDDHDETLRRLRHDDGLVHLAIPVLLDELRSLADEDPSVVDPDFPFVLAAGERRSSTANTIQRDPAWRRKDRQGALRMSVEDALALGLHDGDRAGITTRRGRAVAVVEVSDTMRAGHVSLPNGFGIGSGGSGDAVGVAPNELTSTADRDWFAGTPHHKYVPARIERVGGPVPSDAE